MDFFDILKLAGGLSLFLYGMDTMSQGLTAFSEERMRILLMRITGRRLHAIILGSLVTAVIQSSSAATVMVVGMVNAGLMDLSQAAGVIMGANIGTTITAWLFGLSGIEGDTFFLKLLRPSSFAPILAVAGIVLLLSEKKEKKRNIGMILMGFAVLMSGMETMCQAAAPLARNQTILRCFSMMTHPAGGLIMGTVLTALLQSSSASVGMLQVLCRTGVFHYNTVIPVIMGQNIGTCVSAVLAGIGASQNAKRAAVIHLYFNLIGTVCFLLLYYFIRQLFAPSILNHVAGAFGIAAIHSIYNIFAVAVIFPWADILERLAVFTIP